MFCIATVSAVCSQSRVPRSVMERSVKLVGMIVAQR
jgi:hypothetical protein